MRNDELPGLGGSIVKLVMIDRVLPVIMMISLNNCSRAISLAPLHHLPALIVDLEHPVLPVPVLQSSHGDVLEGDDAFRCCLRGVLKVVKTTIVQHKPTPLPALPASALK